MVLGGCEGGINCVGLTNTWAQIYFFGAYFSLLLLLAIFFIFWKTPALEYVISIITGKSLDIHHKIPFLTSKDNSLENLITLCRRCRMKTEQKIRGEIREKNIKEEEILCQ